jgi:MFS family permease
VSGSPWREPRFRRFVVGHGISLLGDQLYFTALLWVALQATGSATTAGLVLTTATLPRALLMLAGGVLVDRAGSRRIILVADVTRAVVMVTAAVVAGIGAFGVVALFAVAAVFGVVDAAVHPATGAIIPRLVQPDALTAANSVRMLLLRLSSVLVPPIAGVLLAAGRVGWLFLANAATFIASFLAVRSIGLPPPVRGAKPRRFVADLFFGLRYAARQPVLATLLPVSAVVAATFGVLTNAGLPLLAQRNGWGAAGFGLLFGGFGAGAVAGSGLHGLRLWKRPFTGGLILTCMATQAAFFAVMPTVRVMAAAVAMQVAIGFLTGFTGGPLVSLVQAAATEETLGRVMSLHSLTVVGFVPIALGLGGVLADAAGVTALFVGGAAVEAAACVVGMLFTPVRTAGSATTACGRKPA